jgi:molecular chaperone GrpE
MKSFFMTPCPNLNSGSIFVIALKQIISCIMTEEPNKEEMEKDAEKVQEEVQNESSEVSVEDQVAEFQDKYMRLYAEFDNYRRRTNKEKVDLISSAGEGILKDLLPVMDDFERAIKNNETADDIESVKEGFHLIFNKFRHILESKGLKSMNSKGEVFDSELHEAIANVPAPSEAEKGKNLDEVEKGYYLNEKVIRYAKVVVGQ